MFQLRRYFSLTSLAGVALVIVVLSVFYRQLAFRALVNHEIRANASLTRAFANTIWPRYRDFIGRAAALPHDQLARQPEIESLQREVRNKMRGLGVVKVKLYDLEGLTVFSTDPKQIGEDKGSNEGFQSARAGSAVGDITFRDRFDSFEGVISRRDIVFSYVPVVPVGGGPVEGVFEVYSDVTELVGELNRTQVLIVGGVFGSLALLYVFLFAIVHRADGIIRAQERERLANEERIRHQAYHDALTGLPNRTRFNERLDESIKLARRSGRALGLMFLDLDRFKWVNDSLGHDAGDQLLRVVAKRLQWCLRESDMLFRMGGDEFTVLLENLDRPEDAAHVAQRVLGAMSDPVRLHEHDVRVGVSIGITVFPNDAPGPEQLLKNADTAMYRAKESGRNRFAFYTAEMATLASARIELESGLRRGLREDEFELHYQPRLSPQGELLGCEALLRWRHPELGLMSPERFIDLLEDTGLIVPVGEWVLHAACAQCRAWQQAGAAALRVSVNISLRQFRHEGLIEAVRTALSDTGLAPECLELELNERLLVERDADLKGRFEQLKALGVRLSIDDFGAGHSSLGYLRELPVDLLKIDRTFVERLHDQPRSRAIVEAISTLADRLGIGLVAEGVERPEQEAFLRGQRCTEMQGFLYAPALPPEEYAARFLAGRPVPARGAGTGKG